MAFLDALTNVRAKLGEVRDAVMQVTPLERKVRDATTNDPWGARISLKREIAESTHNYALFKEVMGMLWRRMSETGRNYRVIQKALELLRYLLVHGSDHVLAESKVEEQSIRRLQTFYFTDERGREVGAPVRDAAKDIARMIRDSDYLNGERREGRKMAARIHSGIDRQSSTWNREFNEPRTPGRKSPAPVARSPSVASTSPARRTASGRFRPTRVSDSSDSSDEDVSDEPEPSDITIRRPGKKTNRRHRPAGKTVRRGTASAKTTNTRPAKVRRPSFGESSPPAAAPKPSASPLLLFDEPEPKRAPTVAVKAAAKAVPGFADEEQWGFPDDDDEWDTFGAAAPKKAPVAAAPVTAGSFLDSVPAPLVPVSSSMPANSTPAAAAADPLESMFGPDDDFSAGAAATGKIAEGVETPTQGSGDPLLEAFGSALFKKEAGAASDGSATGAGSSSGAGGRKLTIRQMLAAQGRAVPRTAAPSTVTATPPQPRGMQWGPTYTPPQQGFGVSPQRPPFGQQPVYGNRPQQQAAPQQNGFDDWFK